MLIKAPQGDFFVRTLLLPTVVFIQRWTFEAILQHRMYVKIKLNFYTAARALTKDACVLCCFGQP